MACLQQPITATDYRKIFNAVLIGKSGSRFCATASRETKGTRLPRTAMPRPKSIGLSESPENRGGTEWARDAARTTLQGQTKVAAVPRSSESHYQTGKNNDSIGGRFRHVLAQVMRVRQPRCKKTHHGSYGYKYPSLNVHGAFHAAILTHDWRCWRNIALAQVCAFLSTIWRIKGAKLR